MPWKKNPVAANDQTRFIVPDLGWKLTRVAVYNNTAGVVTVVLPGTQETGPFSIPSQSYMVYDEEPGAEVICRVIVAGDIWFYWGFGDFRAERFVGTERVIVSSGSLSTIDTVNNVTTIGNPVTVTEPNPAFFARQPTWLGIYSFSLVDVPGVAAANRFLSVFNPAANPNTMVLLGVYVCSYSVAIAATKNSLRLTRITAATVGTLQAITAINRFQTAIDPNPTMEVRTANPTVTLAAEIKAFGPNEVITAAGTTAVSQQEFLPNPNWGEFVLVPGQGVAVHQTIAGDVDQTYNIVVVWAERI